MRDTGRARLVLALLLLTSFALLTVDYRTNDRSPLRGLERAVAAVVGPGERAVSGAMRPLGDSVRFGGESGRMRRLEKENEQLRRQAAMGADDRRRAGELDRLLGYATYFTVKPADVVSWGSGVGFDRTVAVDIGSADGVRADMTVVSGLGLVGKVVRVQRNTSTVALIDDPGITVGIRLARTGDFGEVTGRPDGRLELTVVKQNASILVGDTVVTLGSTNYVPYVPDVPIGRVVAVEHAPGQLAAKAVVDPFVDLDTLDLLGIVFPPPRRAPRAALIPTPPTTTPTPGAGVTSSPAPGPSGSTGATRRPGRTPSPGASGTGRP